MIKREKRQVNLDKEPVNILQLFKKREFLIYFLILPTIVSVIEGIGGIFISAQGVDLRSESGTQMIVIGYILCLIFALYAVKILYSEDLLYTIQRPRTIILALGLSFLIAYFVSYSFSGFVLNIVGPDHPNYLLIDENIIYYTGNQLMAWVLGGFIVIYGVLVKKIDYTSIGSQNIQQSSQGQRPLRERSFSRSKVCRRCGKALPERARYCDECAYPVGIPKTKEVSYKRVSFKQASDLLDSDTYPRGTRMDIEFECVVLEPPSPEKYGGPAPYRTLRVTDPAHLLARTLYIWGDPGHRYNINLVSSVKPEDRLLVIGPRRPKDSPYYKDNYLKDVFWIERWDGTTSGTGTRLLKLESLPPRQVEFQPPVEDSESSKQEIQTRTEPLSPQQTTITPPFFCQLCSIKHIAGTPRMQCDSCGRYVCVEAFADMAKVGRTNCPMCDGKLTSV
jgi:ribosomal protein L40E